MTTDIIEIIGPPGVGKTTLYQELCRKWRASFPWVCQETLLTAKPHFSDLHQWLQYKIKKALKKNTGRSIPLDFGLRFAHANPELVNFCWHKLANDNGMLKSIALPFRSAFLLYSDFCRYQAINEKGADVPCVLNEGLLQKSFIIQTKKEFSPQMITDYLSLVPAPLAVVHIDVDDPDIMVERLVARKKTIAAHIGKSRNELKEDIRKWQNRFLITNDWMREHGIPVHGIDGTRPVRENVCRLISLLEKAGHRATHSRAEGKTALNANEFSVANS